jgi:hypothetical protein
MYEVYTTAACKNTIANLLHLRDMMCAKISIANSMDSHQPAHDL